MKILLPREIEQRLRIALRSAGDQEVGGILMGEHVADGIYRVQDLTVQFQGGTLVSFVRSIREALGPLRRFFKMSGRRYAQFNYLGEWHSHPSFSLQPSGFDLETMWEIAGDQQVGANFVVLMIVRLSSKGILEGTVTVFLPDRQAFRAQLVLDEAV